jgi:hypothetical protein
MFLLLLWRCRPSQHARKLQLSVIIAVILLAPEVCSTRMLEQQAASRVSMPGQGTELHQLSADSPTNTTAYQKILVSSAAQLLGSVMLGYRVIEVQAHLNLSSVAATSQNFLLIYSGKIFIKVTHPRLC